MDLNGDGNKDLLTGCFEGGLYWMEGLGDSQFAKPAQVLDADGEILRLAQFWCYEDKQWKKSEDQLGISGHAVDFDDDGDFDLLLGSNEGYLFLRENLGSATEPKFSTENIQLKSGEGDEAEALFTGDGHALAIVFDWNQDGLFDLMSGSNRSGIVWSKNIGTRGEPKFAPMSILIEAGQADAEEVPVGTRLQVAAGDFDNDGKPDLLVGDYNNLQVKDQRTEAEKVEFGEVRKSLSKAVRQQEELQVKLEEIRRSDDEDKADATLEVESDIEQSEASYREILERYRELSPQSKRAGFVWLFRQK